MTAPLFEALLDLQRHDMSIDQHRHRIEHLPEAALVAELDTAIAAVSARRATVAVELAEVAARQGALEADLATTEQRSKTVSARMYSGEVSASRDLQAMAADVESLKARASEIEDRILEILEQREPLDGALAAADEEELAALAAGRAAAEQARVDAGAAVRSELDALVAERSAAAATVPADLLADYEGIRSRSGGVGAARLVGSRCDGCHLTMPAVEIDRIRHTAPDTVVHCDECGRILIRS